MSSGRDVMMERWAEEYELQKERNKKQMSFEFDYDTLRERELNDYLEKTWVKVMDDPDHYDEQEADRVDQEQREFQKWLDSRCEYND